MFTLRSSHHAIAVDKLSDGMICLSSALLEDPLSLFKWL